DDGDDGASTNVRNDAGGSSGSGRGRAASRITAHGTYATRHITRRNCNGKRAVMGWRPMAVAEAICSNAAAPRAGIACCKTPPMVGGSAVVIVVVVVAAAAVAAAGGSTAAAAVVASCTTTAAGLARRP